MLQNTSNSRLAVVADAGVDHGRAALRAQHEALEGDDHASIRGGEVRHQPLELLQILGRCLGQQHADVIFKAVDFDDARDIDIAYAPVPDMFSRHAASHSLPKIISTAFSATITIGALVLPPTIPGKTEASTTLKASMPRTHKVGSTTAIGSTAHAAAAHRMMHGGGSLAQIRLKLGIAAHPAAGAHFGGPIGRKCRRIAELPGKSQAAQQRRAVLWTPPGYSDSPGARRAGRCSRAAPHRGCAGRDSPRSSRSHDPRAAEMHAGCGAPAETRSVYPGDPRPRAAANECGRLEHIARQRPATGEHIFRDVPQRARQCAP